MQTNDHSGRTPRGPSNESRRVVSARRGTLAPFGPLGALTACLLLAEGVESAPVLLTQEIRATNTPGTGEQTPALGADGISPYVVYGSSDMILYQRFTAHDPLELISRPVTVSPVGGIAQAPDASGNLVVYRVLASGGGGLGVVQLYEISSGTSFQLSPNVTSVGDAGVDGQNMAWIEGTLSGLDRVQLTDYAELIRGERPRVISGPHVPASNLDVGDTFVVWEFENGTDSDIAAYDIATRTNFPVSAAAGVDENRPATFGSYVAWAEMQGTIHRIMLLDLLTDDLTVVADNGAWSSNPRISGDFLSYESNLAGNIDVYLYQISTGLTFQATDTPDDEYGSNLFGDTLAYLRGANFVGDLFLSRFSVADLPGGAVPAPGTLSLLCLGWALIALDRRRGRRRRGGPGVRPRLAVCPSAHQGNPRCGAGTP